MRIDEIMTDLNLLRLRRAARALPVVCAIALIAGCGGGGNDSAVPSDAGAIAAEIATGTTAFDLEAQGMPSAAIAARVEPTFHLAPVLLDPPDDADASGEGLSALRGPHVQSVLPGYADLPTRRLTLQALQAAGRRMAMAGSDAAPAPLAAPSVVATYTPAQVRAAYALPALPAAGATLTAAQAAQLGAGQTIYIVDAMHNPSIAAELAAFNQKFGLPACTLRTVAPGAALPLAAPSATGCDLSIVYVNAAGAMTATAPAYDAGWATEIALDVQWAHATAPLARIVVIEAPDASLSSLLGGVRLANAMGPGVVSMSFGANEGGYTESVDAAFGAAKMSYLAATGDSGAGVSWPAVSRNVLAVSGTRLTYAAGTPRSEVAWSGSGGGTSLYTPTPSWQAVTVPGLGSVGHRTVGDVSFNADPSSGQYVAVMTPGSATPAWLSAGGTSLSTPQWAGLLAIANAQRAQAGKAPLGAPHAALYGQLASVPGTYAGTFLDIVSGADGSCATCFARVGYDPVTGLGTPHASALLAALGGAPVAATAPVVASAAIAGQVGTPLTFTVSVASPNPVAYSLAGASPGLSISAAGVVSWATPSAGTFALGVTARDSKTGLAGSGVYTVTIVPATPPVVASTSVSAKAGTALSVPVAVTAAHAVALTLSGAPSGMTISAAGVLSWPSTKLGTYAVTVRAKDAVTGLSGQGTVTITISAAAAPVVSAGNVSGRPGVALAFTASATGSGPLAWSLAGAPAGMTVASTGVVSWPRPVAGSFAFKVVAKDSRTGLSGQGAYLVTIAAAGPSIVAAPMTGAAGRPLSGTIVIADPGAASLRVSIAGAPIGMSFSVSGMTFTAAWPAPVAGSYALKVSVTDSAGLSAAATVPISIAAR